MKRKTLISFLAKTLGLRWLNAALLIFFTDPMVATFGEITKPNPGHILMAYSPGYTYAILVWRHDRLKGLGSLFQRSTFRRMTRGCWLSQMVGFPISAYLTAALHTTTSDPLPYPPWYQVYPGLVLAWFLLGYSLCIFLPDTGLLDPGVMKLENKSIPLPEAVGTSLKQAI